MEGMEEPGNGMNGREMDGGLMIDEVDNLH